MATGSGEGREGHDLINLTAGDFYFDDRVQEVGRLHDQLERFAGGENRPHAGESQSHFVARDRHRIEPALIEMFHRHTNQLAQDRLKARSIPLIQ